MDIVGIVSALQIAAAPVAPAAPSELVLDPDSGHIVTATINNYPVRLRVDPETPGYVIVNRETAFRLVLTTPVSHARLIVGPTRLRGFARPAPVSLAGIVANHRVLWTESRVDDVAEGRISPADLPYDRVTLRFHAPAAGERIVELPMTLHRPFGLFHVVTIGEQQVSVRISTVRPETVATAAAGAVAGAEHDGRWTGATVDRMIKYGVTRPVRPMEVASPIVIAGQSLRAFLVRSSDDGSGGGEISMDPDEMIVTGAHRRPNYDISLGLDWLAGCSSLTWDNRRRRMLLSCLPTAPAAASVGRITGAGPDGFLARGTQEPS